MEAVDLVLVSSVGEGVFFFFLKLEELIIIFSNLSGLETAYVDFLKHVARCRAVLLIPL